MKPLLQKLLWKSRSPWQVWGAAIGLFLGLFLLLFSLQIFWDVQTLANGASEENLLVLQKRVEGLSGEKSFSEEEIAHIRAQGFCQDLAPVRSNRYELMARVPQLGFSTLLFCQSVPLDYVDIDSSDFQWSEGDPFVPVVLSNDYLSLYNYGFGPSQGLPKVSADMLGSFFFDFDIRGKNKRKTYKAKVVGLSRKFNSILVPSSFLEASNQQFGYEQPKVSQLILQTDNPFQKSLANYLEEKSYELSRNSLIGGELKQGIFLLLAFLLFLATAIISLSVLVLLLNYRLLVSQAQSDILLLLQLGYRQEQIAKVLGQKLNLLLVYILFGVFAILLPLKFGLGYLLSQEGYAIGHWPHFTVLLSALFLALGILWLNRYMIRKAVQALP